MMNRPAINAVAINIENAIRMSNLLDEPKYIGDLAHAIGYYGNRQTLRVLDVVRHLVKDGYLKEVEGKYGYKKYTRA